MNVKKTKITTSPSGHCLDVLEHIHPERRPCRGESIVALRPDAGRPEAAAYFPVGPEAHAVEHENVLHGDHATFHPRNFANARHLAGAVRHAGDLYDQID